MIVVDASALTDFLLQTRDAVAALARPDGGALHAPELVDLETLNALRGMAARGVIDDERATGLAGELASVRMVRYPHGPLRARVWQLRHQLTAYDASYLALAEALDARRLVTSDRGLARRAAAALGSERVEHLG